MTAVDWRAASTGEYTLEIMQHANRGQGPSGLGQYCHYHSTSFSCTNVAITTATFPSTTQTFTLTKRSCSCSCSSRKTNNGLRTLQADLLRQLWPALRGKPTKKNIYSHLRVISLMIFWNHSISMDKSGNLGLRIGKGLVVNNVAPTDSILILIYWWEYSDNSFLSTQTTNTLIGLEFNK